MQKKGDERDKMQAKDKRIVVWRLCCQGSFRAAWKKKVNLWKRLFVRDGEVLITVERNRIA